MKTKVKSGGGGIMTSENEKPTAWLQELIGALVSGMDYERFIAYCTGRGIDYDKVFAHFIDEFPDDNKINYTFQEILGVYIAHEMSWSPETCCEAYSAVTARGFNAMLSKSE